jgi:hypothetical protein
MSKPETKPWSLVKELAWYGDQRHSADVTTAIGLSQIPDDQKSSVRDRFKSGFLQAQYLSRFTQEERESLCFPVTANTTPALSTAFEANYFGEFRIKYVESTFTAKIAAQILECIPETASYLQLLGEIAHRRSRVLDEHSLQRLNGIK